MNWKSFDWKYFVMFAVTLAGSLIPFYLGQSEQAARSITVKLLASTSLQPVRHAGNRELEVMLDGQKIEDPYFSLLQIINDGSKPILSADFETPIELLIKNNALVVTAQVTNSEPPEIAAMAAISEKKVMVGPYLSNPEDSVFLTVITSGGEPRFETRARIAGVKALRFVDTSYPERSKAGVAFKIFIIFLMISLYFLFMANASSRIVMSRPLAFLTGLCLIFGATFSIVAIRAQVVELLPSGMALIAAVVVLALLAGGVAFQISKMIERAK